LPQISEAFAADEARADADYSGEKCHASALRGESDFIRYYTAFTLNDPRIYSVRGSLFRNAGVGAEISNRSAANPGIVSAELSVDESHHLRLTQNCLRFCYVNNRPRHA
jgi:hypothetical protein